MPRQTKTPCKYLWDPVYADVATGEYHQFSDDAVSIVETAFEMIPALSPQEALLKAFKRAGWTVLLGKHSNIVIRHAGSSLERTFGDRSGEIQKLQAIVSGAIALADQPSWIPSTKARIRNCRRAIRGFSGSSPRDSHVALVRALLESELSGQENEATQNRLEITGSGM